MMRQRRNTPLPPPLTFANVQNDCPEVAVYGEGSQLCPSMPKEKGNMSKNVRNDMHPCPNSNRGSNDSVQNSNLAYICKEGWAEHKETTLQTTSNQVHIIWPIMDLLSSKACNPEAMKT